VTLTAGGAMDLAAGSSVSATTAIALFAGFDAAAGTYAPPGAMLTASGTLSASSIALSAGGAIDATGTMTGAVTQMPFLANPPPPPPPPTLAQCTTTPGLTGCAAVLPSVAACTASPGLAGCSAVVPPATAGSNSAPVMDAINSPIIAINTLSTMLLGSGTSQGDSSSSTGGTGNTSNSGTKSASNTGATNNGNVKKLYCN
jgi:hypothetical protein